MHDRFTAQPVAEREITAPVDICLPDGRLNPDAVGWSRTHLHRANLMGWGRNKRFEYWCIIAPEAIISLNISHHDYRMNLSASFMDRRTGKRAGKGCNVWLPRDTTLHEPEYGATMRAVTRDIRVTLEPNVHGTRLVAEAGSLKLDLQAIQEPDREVLGVLVPWSERLFQYTRKDNCIPVQGVIDIDGRSLTISSETTLALHDHGRGRWPYDTWWNWGAASGVSDGRQVGLNLGGKWTDGTPSTENFLRIDGRIHKVSEHLQWRYDRLDWLAPWRISGERVDLVFTPTGHQRYLFDRKVIMARADHCFGHFDGAVVTDDGGSVAVRNLFGMIEEVHRRW